MIGNKDIVKYPELDYFPSPDQFDPDLQSFLEDASEKLCRWFSSANKTGPLPTYRYLPEIAPRVEGLSYKELLDDIQEVMNGSYQPSHPGALAHLDPPPLSASIVGDMICAGLNNNLLAEELSPSLSKLERNLCKWIARKIGMPASAGGVAASGGSLSNLMGLVLARHQLDLSYDSNIVVFASSDAHVSISRAIKIIGLPQNALCEIPTDSNGEIIIESLRQEIINSRAQGRKCFAVVATAGTTVRGAVDPIASLSTLCKQENLWLHVDGAIGAVFALSDDTSSVVPGLGLADSVTINPQKLIGIAKTSSLLLVANATQLSSCFSIGFPYIEPSWGDSPHGGEIGLQGSRPAEILKLWLGLRQLGENGISFLLSSSLKRRTYFQEKLDANLLNIISGPLHLISFTPSDLNTYDAEKWALKTKKDLITCNFMLSRPFHKGRYYLKAVMGNPNTKFEHLDKLASLINNSQ
ncbi:MULTISPECIES: pyridoxal phosphate-dependent decarboxylase family protein [Prochlorococcus]|uniref:pyridoxal phosphate-dependent decarboxylase family protein n=1 Tax=Prochlorococcus TaxID=1218 RepID=UPI000533B8C9|nr:MULTISPECIES: pyridoxal-dependent decarboxylase [Prochlorococcus]KGG12322.1 pyridoxal-dependent decarboxylase family [Prochlorococcus sp. MIT 0601]